jgi:2-amino-4-hydroxy-6-hydroxymethyldihydropteridine diphosphokinase
MHQHTAYIGLGSNVGDRLSYLASARAALRERNTIERVSSVYETEPVDVVNQPWFLNQVVMVQTSLTPFELLELCLGIEAELGRTRLVDKSPRTIDLDILLYDQLIIDEVRGHLSLIIPHPRLHLRRFVLVPLCELSPQQIHPVLGKTFAELLAELDDPAEVRLNVKRDA